MLDTISKAVDSIVASLWALHAVTLLVSTVGMVLNHGQTETKLLCCSVYYLLFNLLLKSKILRQTGRALVK